MQGIIALRISSSPNTSLQPVSVISDGALSASLFSFLVSKRQHRYAGLRSFSLRGKWLESLGRSKNLTKLVVLRVRASDDVIGKPIAPLEPQSPAGQLLVQLLQSHPHLVPAAAEQQLDKLAEDRDAEIEQKQPSINGAELVLYRRIAQLKAQERRKALEETMYALIVQKFVEAKISMVPKITSLSQGERVDSWPVQDKELESVHSPEALEMIKEHLALVLGGRSVMDQLDQKTVAQISKLHVGQVYAASVMYGYFLKRVDQRFHLEKSMKILPPGLDEAIEMEQGGELKKNLNTDNQQQSLAAEVVATVSAIAGVVGIKKDVNTVGFAQIGMKPSKLRAYVMSCDAETIRRYAMIRSQESVCVIENHTEALFGRPEIQVLPNGSMAVAKDETIGLSFAGLRRLVLEAVAFGNYLCDVETYVDSRYNFVSR